MSRCRQMLGDRCIGDYTAMPVAEAEHTFRGIRLDGRARIVARDILAELRSRLSFLKAVGLSYLALDRAAPSLSGGEAQRIRLASQLGSNLTGVCYILDEPTIGLHARDNGLLLKALHKLKDRGNSILVVVNMGSPTTKPAVLFPRSPETGGRADRAIPPAARFPGLERSWQTIRRHRSRPP